MSVPENIEPGITVAVVPVTGAEMTVSDKSESEIAAKRLVDAVAAGVPAVSLELLGIPISKFKKAADFRQAVKELVANANLDAPIRKQVYRAFLNETVLLSRESTDPKIRKLGLDAAKLMGSDPEIGLLKEEGGSTVVIDLGSLGQVMKNVTLDIAKEND